MTRTPQNKPKLTDAERHKRFVDMAKEVEASEDPKDFDKAFERVSHLPKLTDDEAKVLAALTPSGRHIDACRALESEPTSGWRASKIIERLLKDGFIKKVKWGHYERSP